MVEQDELRRLAIAGVESEIARLNNVLRSLQDVRNPHTPTRGRPRKRRMSPEARKKMSEMMKKRWAARRKAAR